MNLDHQILVDVLCKGRRGRVKIRLYHLKTERGLARKGVEQWKWEQEREMSHEDDQIYQVQE